MPRLPFVLLLAALVLAPLPAAPAAAQSAALTIALDKPDFATSVVTGSLKNVPSDATSATVTITLANGNTKSVTTTAAQGWTFEFKDVYMNAPWLQLAALTSNGTGASLPNFWQANQAANYVAEHTPALPEYTYPAGFPGRWYGYYGDAYGYPYAYGYGLPYGFPWNYGYPYGYSYGGANYPPGAYYGIPGGVPIYYYPYGYGYGYPYGAGYYACW